MLTVNCKWFTIVNMHSTSIHSQQNRSQSLCIIQYYICHSGGLDIFKNFFFTSYEPIIFISFLLLSLHSIFSCTHTLQSFWNLLVIIGVCVCVCVCEYLSVYVCYCKNRASLLRSKSCSELSVGIRIRYLELYWCRYLFVVGYLLGTTAHQQWVVG